nr:hypothetical protein [Tanacetum cinerariifolium]
MTEAQQLKLATKRSLQKTHISQASGSGADEGTGSIPGVPDVPTDESEEEISWNFTNEEGDDDEGKDGDGYDEGNNGDDGKEGDDDDDEQDDDEAQDDDVEGNDEDDEKEGGDDEDEESFDLILKTPKNNDDEGNGEKNLGTNVGRDEGQDEEDKADELYRDVNINLGRGIQLGDSSSVSSQFVTSMLNPNPDAGMESIFETTSQMDVKEQVKVQVSKISPKIEQTVNEQLEAEVLTRSSNSSKTSYAVATDLSEMELKKILIEKMEGNKSIHRSNKQRNLYKALVE